MMPSGHVSCDTAQVLGIAVSLFGFSNVAQVKQEHRSINHNRRGSLHAQRSCDTLLCVNNKDEAGL